MYKSGKSNFVFVLLILSGIVLGGFVGETIGSIPALSWFGYGKQFGLASPLILDLGVITLSFAVTIKFTISGIIGMIIAIFIFKKM